MTRFIWYGAHYSSEQFVTKIEFKVAGADFAFNEPEGITTP
jgi:hypothetical protein